jgi:uncharacterized membrane protein
VCLQPRLYGAEDPMVVNALLTLLHDLAWKATADHHRTAIAEQLERLRRSVLHEVETIDFQRAQRVYREALSALDRRVT